MLELTPYPRNFISVAHHGSQTTQTRELPFTEVQNHLELHHHVEITPWEGFVIRTEGIRLVKYSLCILPPQIGGKILGANKQD